MSYLLHIFKQSKYTTHVKKYVFLYGESKKKNGDQICL